MFSTKGGGRVLKTAPSTPSTMKGWDRSRLKSGCEPNWKRTCKIIHINPQVLWVIGKRTWKSICSSYESGGGKGTETTNSWLRIFPGNLCRMRKCDPCTYDDKTHTHVDTQTRGTHKRQAYKQEGSYEPGPGRRVNRNS